jgi:RNA polymerase sigma-70 factor (TIGR02943 family)
MIAVSEEEKRKTITSWVLEYTDALYIRAINKISSIEIAEDLVQETFLSAFASFEKFKNNSQPKTWLISILNNKIIDFYRKKSDKHVSLDQLYEEKAGAMADEIFDKNGKWALPESSTIWAEDKNLLDDEGFNQALSKCIDSLPSKWALAINSKYLLDKETQEICQDLELTTSNYWQIMHRAKLMLKKCIETNWSL